MTPKELREIAHGVPRGSLVDIALRSAADRIEHANAAVDAAKKMRDAETWTDRAIAERNLLAALSALEMMP